MFFSLFLGGIFKMGEVLDVKGMSILWMKWKLEKINFGFVIGIVYIWNLGCLGIFLGNGGKLGFLKIWIIVWRIGFFIKNVY